MSHSSSNMRETYRYYVSKESTFVDGDSADDHPEWRPSLHESYSRKFVEVTHIIASCSVGSDLVEMTPTDDNE